MGYLRVWSPSGVWVNFNVCILHIERHIIKKGVIDYDYKVISVVKDKHMVKIYEMAYNRAYQSTGKVAEVNKL